MNNEEKNTVKNGKENKLYLMNFLYNEYQISSIFYEIKSSIKKSINIEEI